MNKNRHENNEISSAREGSPRRDFCGCPRPIQHDGGPNHYHSHRAFCVWLFSTPHYHAVTAVSGYRRGRTNRRDQASGSLVSPQQNITHDDNATANVPQDSDLDFETGGTDADTALLIGAMPPDTELANQFPGLPQNARELALMWAKYD